MFGRKGCMSRSHALRQCISPSRSCPLQCRMVAYRASSVSSKIPSIKKLPPPGVESCARFYWCLLISGLQGARIAGTWSRRCRLRQ